MAFTGRTTKDDIRPMIPYSRQSINEDDIKAVTDVLYSDWLTTGSKVAEFEAKIAAYTNVKHGVAVCNGTAALHCIMYALGIQPGDEVIIPPMTFAATASCVIFQGGTPVFVDIDSETLLINPDKIEEKITKRTRAIIAVDYAGQPCNYDRLRKITDKYNIALVADGCHALGGEYKRNKVGSLADITAFSFHPVKPITTGEGGMIVTDNKEMADRARLFRTHNISTDSRQREQEDEWYYEIEDLGYNYRLTDIQCALGISQFKRLDQFIKRRREIAAIYDESFASVRAIKPVSVQENVVHVYHLYVVKIDKYICGKDRNTIFHELRNKGIGANVHYIPVHLHPFYRKKFGTAPGLCPVAETISEQILSLPVFPDMSEDDVNEVVNKVTETVRVQ